MIFITISLGVLVVAALVGTVRVVAMDGYRRVPLDPSKRHR